MCLAQTWHIPGVFLPCTRRAGRAASIGLAAGRERFSRAAARTRSPSARRAAATPTGRPAPPPAPAPGHLPPHYRRAAAAATPRPPRSVTSTRTMPPVARTATVTVTVRPSRRAGRCCRTARSPAGRRPPARVPRAEHPAHENTGDQARSATAAGPAPPGVMTRQDTGTQLLRTGGPCRPKTQHGRLRHLRTPAVIQVTAAGHQAAHRNWARRPQPQDETRRTSRLPS